MHFLSSLQKSGGTMKRKLFGYMLALAVILVITLITGLLLFGRFSSVEKEMSEILKLQMEVFSKDITSSFEENAVTNILLSKEMTKIIEDGLEEKNISFSDLTDNYEVLAEMQNTMIEPLRHMMMQNDCSGAFVLLEATVNSKTADSEHSRSGLYIQKSETMSPETNVLLYRGNPEIGKAHGIMPHRKWRLEFKTDLFPNYDAPIDYDRPLDNLYRLTNSFILPGTSEKAVLMTLPMIGDGGIVYGICGFEISQSYFQMNMSQPSSLPYLTCLLTTTKSGFIQADEGFSSGVDGGYYLAPKGNLTLSPMGSDLYEVKGGTLPYIGIIKSVSLTPQDAPFTMAVMSPKSYYDHETVKSYIQVLLLLLLLLFFTVTCCIYFTRRFLSPVLRSLENIKSNHSDSAEMESSGFQEIDDLFGFLAEKDKDHENALRLLRQEKQDAQSRAAEVQMEYEKAQTKYKNAQNELARISQIKIQDVNPDEYKLFAEGIKRLTPTESEIFRYYLEGHNVKEIMEIAGIKESTLRYHNRNIYSKLGVNSLKQLLRYAALMSNQEES